MFNYGNTNLEKEIPVVLHRKILQDAWSEGWWSFTPLGRASRTGLGEDPFWDLAFVRGTRITIINSLPEWFPKASPQLIVSLLLHSIHEHLVLSPKSWPSSMKNNPETMDFTQRLHSMHSNGIKQNRPAIFVGKQAARIVFLHQKFSMILKSWHV